MKEEGKKDDEVKKEDPQEEEMEDDGLGAEPPKVELDDEEKKTNFVTPKRKDLLDSVLNSSFRHFSIPDKSEGFDEIKFEWQPEGKSRSYLDTWRKQRKLTTRIDDIQAGEWFKTTLAEFQKTTEDYQAKQKEYKKKAPKLLPKKKAEDDEDEEPEKAELDLFEVQDVCDIGAGEPLFANFIFEDWALFTLRYEMYLLAEGFKKDVDDPERTGFHESHFSHYYARYFKKTLNPKAYGKDNIRGLCEHVADTVGVDPDTGLFECKLAADAKRDVSDFLKAQEECRRERQRRLDAGDERGRICFDLLKKTEEAERQRLVNEKKRLADTAKAKENAAKLLAKKAAEDAQNKSSTKLIQPANAKSAAAAGSSQGPAKWSTAGSAAPKTQQTQPPPALKPQQSQPPQKASWNSIGSSAAQAPTGKAANPPKASWGSGGAGGVKTWEPAPRKGDKGKGKGAKW